MQDASGQRLHFHCGGPCFFLDIWENKKRVIKTVQSTIALGYGPVKSHLHQITPGTLDVRSKPDEPPSNLSLDSPKESGKRLAR